VARAVPFVHPIDVRYLEVDQQGVVFNMWYLAYFDDAMTAFLAAGGLPYGGMLGSGVDAQVVHCEIDWLGPLGFGDPAAVTVAVAHIGRTSFTLRFDVMSGARAVARGQTVYVAVGTDGSGKVELPPALRAALGPASAPAP
jgi:acyl-CoA thioester hydrolase